MHGIVKTVSENLIKHSPGVILIIVSNPMDTMTYLVHKVTGLQKIELSEWVDIRFCKI